MTLSITLFAGFLVGALTNTVALCFLLAVAVPVVAPQVMLELRLARAARLSERRALARR